MIAGKHNQYMGQLAKAHLQYLNVATQSDQDVGCNCRQSLLVYGAAR